MLCSVAQSTETENSSLMARSQLVLASRRNDYYISADLLLRWREKQEGMFRLRKRDWIIPTALIVAVAVGYGVYSEWAGLRFEAGLRRTEADMKSNLPLRVDQNTTLVHIKYERTHSSYWYVIDNADQFDPQETARQVQSGVCTNACRCTESHQPLDVSGLIASADEVIE
jgi:hypothetical protein